MKHVLVLNQFALPRTEGGGTRHIDLFSRLRDWTPLIVAGDRNHYTQRRFTTADDRFVLVAVPSQDGRAGHRLASWLAYTANALRVGLSTPYLDAVVASSPHLLAPLAGWVIARLRRVPYILEVRDLWPESFVAAGLLSRGSLPHNLLRALEKFICRRADSIIVVTPGWEQHFTQLGVIGKVVVIPNGTERADHYSDHDRETLQRELALTPPVAVFAGAHGPKDGIDLILDAAAALPDVTFLLLGDGPVKADAMERARTEALHNVVFRDPVPKAELAKVLCACDVGVHSVTPLPVFNLGMSPNKLFDYLACSLPVASNAGAPVEAIIGRDGCGRVGDSTSLAAGIRAILASDHKTRDLFAARGLALIETTYSRTASSRRLAELLNRVTASGATLNQPRAFDSLPSDSNPVR